MLVAKDPADMPEIVRTELVFGPLDGEVKYFQYPGPNRLEFQLSDETTLNGISSGRSNMVSRAYQRVHKHYFVYEPYLEMREDEEAGQ